MLLLGLAMADRPLTTGEGTTADLDAISRRWYMGYDRGAHDYTDAGCRVLAEHGFADVAALLAECSRLREQLDAARQALIEIDNLSWADKSWRSLFIECQDTARAGLAAATPDTPPKTLGGALGQTPPESRGGDS